MKVKVKFTSNEELFSSYEVPNTSFPCRQGCRVTLFQDAHIGEEITLPQVHVVPSVKTLEVIGDDEDPDEDNEVKKKKRRKNRKKREKLLKKMRKHKNHFKKKFHHDDEEDTREISEIPDDELPVDEAPTEEWIYKRKDCWRKIYKSILRARHFIYITGWSVDTSISLIREKPVYRNGETPQDDDDNGMLTIGELLKRKASEGVKVCLLLWNEATSVSGMGREGIMFTHDEFTKSYFEDTGVTVALAYRDGSVSSGNKFLWTHHQKSVILDAESIREDEADVDDENQKDKRRIIAFVGGLDLCDGRWDTPQHSLFRTLKTHHKSDFHQVWAGITAESGPREPWHDIHSRIEGPIARDVMRNFEQRWRKQADMDDELVNLEDLPIISVDEEMVQDPQHWASWSVQLFRSIDDYSAIMETDDRVDKSIQLAYIHHIRRARRFIFIENQYFLGSAQGWENEEGEGIDCKNLIPLELTMKIIEHIKQRKPFTVYVVLPMYPEGIPDDGAVQEILGWQYKTIQMMYARIYRALEEEDLLEESKPEDYLLFFCMGQRETEDGSQAEESDCPSPNEIALKESRRFAIYVHSKMMIVDDDYIIVGSANINERSMNGERDTEIAIGAYQPYFTNETCSNQPRGDIHGFRMGLWSSHLRRTLPCFLEPESAECARTINEIASENWRLFAGDEVVEMEEHGHLLKYPLAITSNGKVVGLPNNVIPDTEAPVTGTESALIPNILTL